ncbi:pirin family protein [Nocardioides cheoyonin]|uniref:pirin family protein n=1 Tax=Nocardioides cheoyonin TaxID=3156615 RepID=UPI0032B626C0
MTWHSFSFGGHYDPTRTGYGPMVCHDEHLLGEGRGFDTHHHERLEIVTWVLSGALEHRDSTGSATVLRPGSVGLLSAGSGVEHSEIASAPQTRFVQVWLAAAPGAESRPPSYAVSPVPLVDGSFVEALRVADVEQGPAVLSVARLDAGQEVVLPEGRLRHLFVASGALLRNSLAEPLVAGDAFEISDERGPVAVTAGVPTQLLLWSFA